MQVRVLPEPPKYTMNNIRFKLEEDIMRAWSVTDQIDALLKLHDTRDLSYDELANLLLGIQSVANMNFEILWKTFVDSLKK